MEACRLSRSSAAAPALWVIGRAGIGIVDGLFGVFLFEGRLLFFRLLFFLQVLFAFLFSVIVAVVGGIGWTTIITSASSANASRASGSVPVTRGRAFRGLRLTLKLSGRQSNGGTGLRWRRIGQGTH